MIRKLRNLLLLLIAVLLLAGGILIKNNNRQAPTPTKEELAASLEKAIQYLATNRDRVLAQKDPILLWMIQESGGLTKDERLRTMAADYVAALPGNSPWQYLFNRDSHAQLRLEILTTLPDYNFHFLYGLTCDDKLGAMEKVQQQNEEGFCLKNHPLSPVCRTHQLMGLRFMQRRGCGDKPRNAGLVADLQRKIQTELTWDPRVVDLYIQRLLMLVESGVPPERVKPVWLCKVLAAQLPDGGWGNFQPLIPMWKSRAIGFTARGIGLARPQSTLHATAEGVFLLSLLTAWN
ncbi:MAG: hypothetical protein COX17_02295 [Deltaproteobacteria bacterium CG23_combo_of_CG06-09_8_20_14_all_60_8]|nr:MAG: hypothetical protein AUK28_10770 [Desulfobacterales bacterium CG2_30_60_27]PIP44278.1 MAG: hypothetical protein COX17_02295 [Deltaproteobacteria bacterium CG23_combo_of_CG06-09_8_20_14_all_60_8]